MYRRGLCRDPAGTLCRMLDLTPDPVALQIGPFPIYWYGIGYAVGLALAYLLLVRLAKRAGEDPDVVGNGIIIVADRGADRRPALPRHRPMGAVQGRPAQDRPAPVHRPRGLRRDHHRHGRGVPVRPLQARPVPALGGHRRAGPVRDAGRRALGQLLQPGAVRHAHVAARGASRSTAPTASPRIPAPSSRKPRPRSTRCSCTSRSRGSSARWC